MISKRFEYHMPHSVEEAVGLLAEKNGEAVVLGGGTWVVPDMTHGVLKPGHVVDLRKLGLDAIEADAGGIRIGATATYTQIAESALVQERAPALHTLARAAAVEVDLVVAPASGQTRAVREVVRFTAAQLQRDRMLHRIEVQMPRHVAMQQRTGGHHFGVEARAPGDEAVQDAAATVGPVHHRRDGKAPGAGRGGRRWHARIVAGAGQIRRACPAQ